MKLNQKLIQLINDYFKEPFSPSDNTVPTHETNNLKRKIMYKRMGLSREAIRDLEIARKISIECSKRIMRGESNER